MLLYSLREERTRITRVHRPRLKRKWNSKIKTNENKISAMEIKVNWWLAKRLYSSQSKARNILSWLLKQVGLETKKINGIGLWQVALVAAQIIITRRRPQPLLIRWTYSWTERYERRSASFRQMSPGEVKRSVSSRCEVVLETSITGNHLQVLNENFYLPNPVA